MSIGGGTGKGKFVINEDSLEAYAAGDDSNPYFSVNSSGLTYGDYRAITQTDLNENYYTKLSQTSIFLLNLLFMLIAMALIF